MLYSMTGFGKATTEFPDKKVSIEIRSLNSKQLDLNARIPIIYREKEADIRNYLSQQLERGKVDISINIEYIGVNKKYSIDRKLALAYYHDLCLLSKEINAKTEPEYISVITRLPDVVKNDVEEFDETEWIQVFKAIEHAIQALQMHREKEGNSLEKEFNLRTKLIEQLLDKVKVIEPKRKEMMKQKLHGSISEAIGTDKIDQNRLEQELIFYIERLDITEEMVRLKSHIQYFEQCLAAKETSKGKKIGFILQEMGREINTIGSKANYAEMQRIVIEMKDELEKLKEQSMNIL